MALKSIFLSGTLVLSLLFSTGLQGQALFDATFAANGHVRADLDEYDECRILHTYPGSRKLLLGGISGHSATQGFDMDMALVRLLENGQRDSSFGNDGVIKKDFSGCDYSTLEDMLVLPDGKILVLGRGSQLSVPGVQPFFIARFLPDGEADTTFGTQGETSVRFISRSNDAYSLTCDSMGRIYAVGVGYDTSASHTELPAIVRLLPNGIPDSIFGGTGRMVLSFIQGELLPVQNNLVMGNERHINGGFFSDVLVLPDGKLLCSGAYDNGVFRQSLLVKMLPEGGLDSSFMNNGISVFDIEPGYENYIRQIRRRDDGRLFMSIVMNCPFFANDWYMATCPLDEPDAVDFYTYDLQSHEDRIRDFVFLPDGQLIVTGYSSDAGNSAAAYASDYFALGRVTGTGAVFDPLFHQSGYAFTEFEAGNYRSGANSVVIQDDDKIVLGGMVNTSGEANAYDMAVLRLSADLTVMPDAEDDLQVQVWPNPADDLVNISLATAGSFIRLLDARGAVYAVLSGMAGNTVQLDISSLPPGMYFLQAETAGNLVTRKLIVR